MHENERLTSDEMECIRWALIIRLLIGLAVGLVIATIGWNYVFVADVIPIMCGG